MRNVGKADRIARAVIGLAVLSLVFVGPKTHWGWLGLVPLGTALFSWCPLYSVLGIHTGRHLPAA
jgi:Inner membrane protein YgaP-like, transmembrane domain